MIFTPIFTPRSLLAVLCCEDDRKLHGRSLGADPESMKKAWLRGCVASLGSFTVILMVMMMVMVNKHDNTDHF